MGKSERESRKQKAEETESEKKVYARRSEEDKGHKTQFFIERSQDPIF